LSTRDGGTGQEKRVCVETFHAPTAEKKANGKKRGKRKDTTNPKQVHLCNY